MIQFGKLILTYLVLLAAILSSCSKGANPDTSSAVPDVTVNITINIDSSIYAPLATTGGTVYITGGYRGILLYRYSANTILAFDRTCPYDISNSSAFVEAQTNGTAICLDCGSTYNLVNGDVGSGPSTIGLKEYKTSFTPNTGKLTITN